MLRTSDLEYDLPEDRVATVPAEPRDSARLMVVRRDGGSAEHRRVRDLPEYLRAGDLLVLNTARVLAARLVGVREDTGGRAEALYLREESPGRWVALVKSRRLKAGMAVRLEREGGADSGVRLRLVERRDEEPGAWLLDVEGAAGRATAQVLADVGRTPLPPYILAARRHAGLAVPDAQDRARYQTTYAAGEGASVAAPTAGLHLTPELLEVLAARGVRRADVTLHVGTGTFKPVETEFVEQHPMHEESCEMPVATREAILRTRDAGGRVVCVGTTACRTVEAFAAADAGARALATRLLVTPGYGFRWTDALLTNFHLPRSTLMALVAASLGGGAERLKRLYDEALREGYRFYSYGDAMLILP